MPKENGREHNEETPIPTGQLTCVVFMQLAESTTINVLFPFIVFMVADFGMKPIGLYAGLLAASFSGAQFCSSMLWGRFSDRYGRRPALMLGLVGSAISSLIFGFSKSYSQAIAARLAAGLLNGNIGVLKCFLTEITTDSNRSRGFSMLSLAYSIGSIISPMAGGLLAKPGETFPHTFNKDRFEPNTSSDVIIELFIKYPYLLPILVPLLFQIIAIFTCLLFVKETVKSRTIQVNNNHNKTKAKVSKKMYSPIDSQEEEEEEVEVQLEPKPTSTLSNPPVLYTTINYGIIAFAYVILDETLPLFFQLPSSLGGLNFSSKQIGQVLSVCGIIHFFYVTILLPNVDKHIGGRFNLLHVGNLVAIPFVMLIPIQTLIKNSASAYSDNRDVDMTDETDDFNWSMFGFYVSIISVLALKNVFCSMSFLSIMIMVNHSVVPSKLGVVNGFGQSLASLARCVGPALGGVIWSLTVVEEEDEDSSIQTDDDDIGTMGTSRSLSSSSSSSSSFALPVVNFVIVSVCLLVSSLIGVYKMPKTLESQLQEDQVDVDDDDEKRGDDDRLLNRTL